MAARNRPSRSMRQQRSPPPRRSDERNNHHQPSRYDFMDMGMGGPPPQSLARRAQEMGMSSRGYPPQSAKLSGNAFSEAELLNEIPKKKFTGRCRLFVGNLPIDLKEEELKELFTPHGDLSECYLSGKGFAFLRLDSRAHAESAKEALDGKSIKGRQIRVRFAVHGATIKVKELSPAVSNEMLNLTFGAFGEVERAIHIVDEKGRPTGEGIIEFEKKSSAQEALAQIKERVFLMTANSRPLQVEILDPKDEEDGLSEKMIQKTHQLIKERELGPRFAAMNSFEYVYGRRWKELYDFEHKRRQELDAELREGRRRLDADMEVAYEDYKAELLREELERRKEELDRLEAARRARDQQRQQMMDQMGERWVPPIVDGPMGRPPPTFGGRGGPHGGGGAGMAPPHPFGNQQGMGLGGLFDAGDGRGLLPPHQQANGHGQPGGGQPQQQSLLGPDVRKLLQTFKDSPNIPGGSARPGSDIGRQQGLLGAPPAPGGGIPPPPNPLGGGGPDSSPLSIFANMINPLMQRPPSGGAGGHQQQQGPPPPPFGAGTGGRIPPPPPPMGAMPPPPQMMNMMMQDYPPPEKRTRH